MRELLILTLTVVSCQLASGDILHLNNSGMVRGKVSFEPTDEEPFYRITLVNGAQLEISASEVKSFDKRPFKAEIYVAKAKNVERTLKGHWELAEWCRTNRLESERAEQLELVLQIDPGHRKAHYGLGHTLRDGQWLTKDEYDQARRDEGFVKFNGRWVRAEQLESVQAKDAATKAELEWFRKVRVWLNWATGSSKRQADGLANLRTIRDPDAIGALTQFLGKSDDKATRRLYIELIGRMGGERPVPALTTLGLRDEFRELRELAFNAIKDDQKKQVQELLIGALNDKNNVIVRRAGEAIGRFGDEKAIPALINALVTKHSYKARVPVEGYAYGKNGTFLPSSPTLPPNIMAGIRSGLYSNAQVIPLGPGPVTKIVPFALNQQNPEVLASLKKFTKVDFGFDENKWLRWWKVERPQAELAPDLK